MISINMFHNYPVFILSVPVPAVIITLSHTPPLYTGIILTLTCTVTLDPNVDSGERVVTEWSGLQDIPQERYSVTAASGSGTTYTGSLTINPLAYQDTGTYTCTGTVTRGFHQTNASDDISINVNSESGKYYILYQVFMLIPQIFPCYSSESSKRPMCAESECYTYDSELDCSQSSGGKRTHHLLHSQLLACLQ